MLNVWAKLNMLAPCALLSDADGDEVLRTASLPPDMAQFEMFRRVSSITVPDVSALTWDRIIELRNHPYFEKFRSVLRAIDQSAGNATDAELRDMIGAMRLTEMEHIVRSARPSVGRALVSAFFGNLPIPPVNPLAIATSIKDVFTAWKRSRHSGWLYFLMDMEQRH